MTPTIESLPGKWRADATSNAKYSVTDYEAGRIAEARACADELAAALATQSTDGVVVAATLDDAAADPALTLETARGLLRDAANGIRTLASQPKDGELLALADRMRVLRNELADYAKGLRGQGVATPCNAADLAILDEAIRTLASRRVTEEMVTRLIRRYQQLEPEDDVPGVDDPETRKFARELLTAALQPDTLSKSQVKRIALERGESPGQPDCRGDE